MVSTREQLGLPECPLGCPLGSPRGVSLEGSPGGTPGDWGPQISPEHSLARTQVLLIQGDPNGDPKASKPKANPKAMLPNPHFDKKMETSSPGGLGSMAKSSGQKDRLR